jgi:uncharacterized protein
MSLKSKLNRFRPHITNQEPIEKKIIEPEIEIPFIEKWEQEGVSPYYLDNQFCLIRKVKYPLSYQHGNYLLGDYLEAVQLWNESDLNHPLSTKGYNPNQLFFFDTETTGLGGGVGNSIFILGHASLSENEIILTQHILPNPGAEIPLYYSFLNEVDYRTLVTYNGKSFDWPQVKTRHTLIRDHVPKLPEFGHFDLYHSAKRMWKHRLERMKLSIVEKEVLGVNRIDDVPGFLAPMIYFDFVERKEPEGMLKILKHNEIDILSLITLYSHLSFQILEVDRNQTMQEKYELGRWFSSLGEVSLAKNIYHGIETTGSREAVYSQLNLGYIYKKQKDYHQSLDYFKKVVNQIDFSDLQVEACVEVAKILEHHNKNYTEAIVFCELALKLIERGCIHRKISISDIEKRKDRNLRKNNFLGKRKIHDKSPN